MLPVLNFIFAIKLKVRFFSCVYYFLIHQYISIPLPTMKVEYFILLQREILLIILTYVYIMQYFYSENSQYHSDGSKFLVQAMVCSLFFN